MHVYYDKLRPVELAKELVGYNVLLWHGATNGFGTNVDIKPAHSPYVTQSEVACTHCHLTLTTTSLLSSNHWQRHQRVARPRFRGCLALLQSGSCVHGSITHAHIRLHRYTRRYTRRHQHAQMDLSLTLWILFLLLLINISPSSCSGA